MSSIGRRMPSFGSDSIKALDASLGRITILGNQIAGKAGKLDIVNVVDCAFATWDMFVGVNKVIPYRLISLIR
jgi:hypothetical protein